MIGVLYHIELLTTVEKREKYLQNIVDDGKMRFYQPNEVFIASMLRKIIYEACNLYG